MIRYTLFESHSKQTMPVVFSSKIENKIKSVYEYNQDNQQALSKWDKHINWIKEYISQYAVAFDYGNNHRKFPNGTKYIPMLDVAYTIKNNSYGVYVYVYLLKVKPQEYGLRIPQDFNESRVNTYLFSMIQESVRTALREYIMRRNRYNYH